MNRLTLTVSNLYVGDVMPKGFIVGLQLPLNVREFWVLKYGPIENQYGKMQTMFYGDIYSNEDADNPNAIPNNTVIFPDAKFNVPFRIEDENLEVTVVLRNYEENSAQCSGKCGCSH